MRPFVLLASLLLIACPMQVDDGINDDDDPAPTPEPTPEPLVAFTGPGSEAANPVTFTVRAPEGATRVRYLSQGVTTMGESDDPGAEFAFTWRFELLGDTFVEAWAFEGDEYIDDARIELHVLPDPLEANDFGVWIEDPADLPTPVDELAQRLGELGVSRVYVPIGEGLTDCVSTPTLCDHALTDAFREAGVSPYAWSVADLSDPLEQAGLLFDAVPAGYHGLVLAVDDRWVGLATELEDLALSYTIVRTQCDTSGAHLAGEFPLWAGHGAGTDADSIAALDARLDGFMPRVDGSVIEAICALRASGATRPVHPVLDLTDLPAELDESLAAAGRRASFRWLPQRDDDVGQAALDSIPWSFNAFEDVDCP
jgi:hypothetical protein